MAWVYLVIAGIMEVVWATAMKYSEGFSRLWPSIITLVFMIISFALLSQAMKTLPLGTAYAVWTGIGAVGSVLVGILFFADSTAPLRLLFISLILIGVVGLKLVGE
ncbi:MAG: quaternary ammonium compound efflux SMR transporter SugE [Firmicutes bacterium]|nr:quaternary ammonium compound efflux SMR transporter SugE [Bacillota bacterium]